MKQKKRKLLMTGVTLTLCLTILLTGTFAWTSISQFALNEVTGTINSGGRLHDDFDGSSNKDIYVENYTSAPGSDLIVRVRLREYMELSMENGTAYKSAPDLGKEDRDNWPIYRLPSAGLTQSGNEVTDQESGHFDAAHPYCQWTFGGQTVYRPTANKDNTSKEPDLNGTRENKYQDYTTYTEGQDGAKKTLAGTVVSLTQWETALNSECGPYWIYDDSEDGDGWFYWGERLSSGTATGLLLSAIRMNIPDDQNVSVYYGIYVESQMVTPREADVLADTSNVGGGGVSDRAGTLLAKLTETVPDTAAFMEIGSETEQEKIRQAEIQKIYEDMLEQEAAEEEAKKEQEDQVQIEETENTKEPEETEPDVSEETQTPEESGTPDETTGEPPKETETPDETTEDSKPSEPEPEDEKKEEIPDSAEGIVSLTKTVVGLFRSGVQ